MSVPPGRSPHVALRASSRWAKLDLAWEFGSPVHVGAVLGKPTEFSVGFRRGDDQKGLETFATHFAPRFTAWDPGAMSLHLLDPSTAGSSAILGESFLIKLTRFAC
jgi:hypothetical protein